MKKDVVHHSRLLCDRSPQGPLCAGEALTVSITAARAYKDASVTLILRTQKEERRNPMAHEEAGGAARFTCTVHMPPETGLVWYYFMLDLPEGERLYYGGESGEGAIYRDIPPGYQVTVYDGAFTTPRWFREGVMYQIFPDRFRHGGDSTVGLAYHRKLGRTVRVHGDWYQQPDYLPAPGAVHYQPNDFYLGDLAGIAQSLEYFKSLHVSCIYLNPIFESASNHRYDTADYRRVDPLLGDNDAFKALCERFGENGIRIMLDGVFSHTGADSVYFNKYGRYPGPGAYQAADTPADTSADTPAEPYVDTPKNAPAKSPYAHWYEITKGGKSEYRAWWGFEELPEVNEMSPDYLEFVMDGEDSLLKHWAGHHMTSWRLDVADELPDAFITRMRAQLKQIDPEGVLLGEVWEDASNKEAYGELRTYVLGHSLDSVMNYPFQKAVIAFMRGEMDAHGLNHSLQTLRERYPKPFYYALMNLLSTHDSVRALSALGGAPDRDALSREAQASFTLTKENMIRAKERLVAATALQMAMPGVPSVYYGDEAGLCGMADPFNRAAYPWGREDRALLTAFRAYTAARDESPAMRAGYCRMGACALDVFAVLRFTLDGQDAFDNAAEDDAVLLYINRARMPMHVRMRVDMLNEGPDADKEVSMRGVWREVRTGKTVAYEGNAFEVIVPASGALLFRRENV